MNIYVLSPKRFGLLVSLVSFHESGIFAYETPLTVERFVCLETTRLLAISNKNLYSSLFFYRRARAARPLSVVGGSALVATVSISYNE